MQDSEYRNTWGISQSAISKVMKKADRVHCIRPTTLLGGSPQVVLKVSSGAEPLFSKEFKVWLEARRKK